jgi:hypothetical protein
MNVMARSLRTTLWEPGRALRISSMLTDSFRRMYNAAAMDIQPEDVIKLLNQAGAKFVLMGAHGIGHWMSEPRATRDVDVLVQKSHHRMAIRALRAAYPELLKEDYPAVTRFLDPADHKVVIDVMKPVEEIYQAALKNTTAGGKTYRIPTLEIAVACKFAALTSPNRTERKKHLDAADLIAMVEEHSGDIKEDILFSFGEMVRPGGGGEVLKLIKDIRAGRPILSRWHRE